MDALQALVEQIADTAARVDNNRRGHVVAELTLITLLIDAGIVSIAQVCERLELIQSVLPERYQSDEAKRRTEFLVQWLREHEKPAPTAWSPRVIEGGKDHD